LERAPVRVTLKALNAVPLIEIALEVSAGFSPRTRETPEATSKDPGVVWSNPLARTGATSHSRQST